MRVLIDVDGVVADLMAGFAGYMAEQHGVDLERHKITKHNIPNSPAHAELHARYDLNRCLREFMSLSTCYTDRVPLIEGSVDAIDALRKRPGAQLAFVTATDFCPTSYLDKFNWLARHFPGIPVISCPSAEKYWISADYGIDDRYDTCARWRSVNVTPFLFRQPWNEAPPGVHAYDWKEILSAILYR